MNIFNSVLPRSMSRFMIGVSFLGLAFAGSAHAAAPNPVATITVTPDDPSSSNSARFEFTGNEDVTSFECALDAATFSSCTSPRVFNGLSEDSHTFQVRGMNNNKPGSPASYTWTVALPSPVASITAKPSNPSSSTSPTFKFTGTNVTGYQCKLDSAAYKACTSPHTINGISEGAHTFYVRGVNDFKVGVPAIYTWTVDTNIPDTTAPSLTSSYISSGGTLLVLKYDEDLKESSVPNTGDFTVNDGAAVPVSAVSVAGDRVVLKLVKSIQAADETFGKHVLVSIGYSGGAIKDLAGNSAAKFSPQDVTYNNSAKFPMTVSFNDGDSGVDCGAWKIELKDDVIMILSTYCGDSMPVDGPKPPETVALGFSEDEKGSNPTYCGSFDSLKLVGDGDVRITTSDNCVVDRDTDGIPGVVDAAPDAQAGDACIEEASGEVNLANGNPGNCSAVVSVVTGKNVIISSNTEYTAGEFIRLLPGFSVVQGVKFRATTNVL